MESKPHRRFIIKLSFPRSSKREEPPSSHHSMDSRSEKRRKVFDSSNPVITGYWVEGKYEHGEYNKMKTEAEKDATSRGFEKSHKKRRIVKWDSDDSDEYEDLARKPIGPVDPSKCTAVGNGIAGGTACAASSFSVVTKDSDERKVLTGGAHIKVCVRPGLGVDQEGIIVKDMGDGTYTVTYVAPKRGNYMVNVECNGKPIMGSPFPVFFSAAGNSNGGLRLRTVKGSVGKKKVSKIHSFHSTGGAAESSTVKRESVYENSRRCFVECKKEKKMDRYKKMQCWVILKRMMTGRDGWALKKPLDLNVFGDVESKKLSAIGFEDIEVKLNKLLYSKPEDLAKDIRFVFSHALLYPPRSEIHRVARRLSESFEHNWKTLMEKWALEKSYLK